MSKFIILIILVVALCTACSMACHQKDESTVIQKIEKQWAEEYDIYRLPQKACLKP